MLYIGLDPGESWCGFAALEITQKNEVRVEARTYHVPTHGGYLKMSRDILELVPRNRDTNLVVEDFRIRRSGHQRFSRGDTLRFLGALEYGSACQHQSHFYLIPPNDHGELETRELFGKVLMSYRKDWPKQSHHAWGHCLSAWRVLGQHLFHHNRDLLLKLHEKKKSHRCDRWLPALMKSKELDRVAPAAIWAYY